MTFRIDVMTTNEKDKFQDQWKLSIKHQKKMNKFVDATLHRVYKKINKTGYDFISISQWKDEEALKDSVKDKACYQFIFENNRAMKTNQYEICNGIDKSQESSVPGNLVVTNPYRIKLEDADEYAEMWNTSKEHMKDREGFVNAFFYKRVGNDGDYYFVSRAEWRSEDLFMNQFSGKNFQKIVEPFEDIFSICLSKVVCTN